MQLIDATGLDYKTINELIRKTDDNYIIKSVSYTHLVIMLTGTVHSCKRLFMK